MNQKQKDLLCKLLQTEADKTKKLLLNKFPLVSERSYYNAFPGHPSEIAEELLEALPSAIVKAYRILNRRNTVLNDAVAKLTKDWKAWQKTAALHEDAQKDGLHDAKERLMAAVSHAVIDIQFVEDAETAKAIINSLPTVDQLV